MRKNRLVLLGEQTVSKTVVFLTHRVRILASLLMKLDDAEIKIVSDELAKRVVDGLLTAGLIQKVDLEKTYEVVEEEIRVGLIFEQC